jgi:hypothetical protein
MRRPPISSSTAYGYKSTGIYTIINENEVNLVRGIKLLENLFIYKMAYITACVKIVTIGVLRIYTVNHRLTLVIGFNTESFVSVTMRLHLLGVEALNSVHPIFYPLNRFGAKRTIIG